MSRKTMLIPVERIEQTILFIRGHKVILDNDLADLYCVPTKVLNQAVKRHKNRFPNDFIFRLTKNEKLEVVTACDHLQKLKFSSTLPFAFTEHGTLMTANVLKSQKAITASILIVRTFVKLRMLLASHAALARRIESLEKKYNKRFRVVFDTIRQLMKQPESPRQPIGFRSHGKT